MVDESSEICSSEARMASWEVQAQAGAKHMTCFTTAVGLRQQSNTRAVVLLESVRSTYSPNGRHCCYSSAGEERLYIELAY